MKHISIQKHNVSYYNGVFTVSGKNVKFDTSYSLKNEETGNEIKFEFKESTGSEWDTNTIWIYESVDYDKDINLTLHLLNDDVTERNMNDYLESKLRY